MLPNPKLLGPQHSNIRNIKHSKVQKSLKSGTLLVPSSSDSIGSVLPSKIGRSKELVCLPQRSDLEKEVGVTTQITGLKSMPKNKLLSFSKTSDPHCKVSAHLNRKREPRRMKSDLLDLPFPGVRRRKKAWCSTAHFHRCLQVRALSKRNTNVCSCSRPWGRKQGPSCAHITWMQGYSQQGGQGERGLPGHHPRPPQGSVCSF